MNSLHTSRWTAARVYTQRLGYGSTGQRTTHRLVAGGYDQTTAWSYTDEGRLQTLTPPGQPTATTLEYNADGLNIGRYAPGLAFTTGFSGVHAPSGLSYGVPALNREYGYEPTTGFLNTRIQADSAKEYAYDALGQLSFIKRYTVTDPTNDCGQVVEATGESSDVCKTRRSGGLLTHSVASDALGNRTDQAGSGYESANRQSSFNGMSYSYDRDGNRTVQYLGTGGMLQYRWSATGELTAVLRSVNLAVQDSTTFTYDGLGRRITKTSTLTGAHEYLLDGDNLLAELDAAGAIRTEYTAYPGIDTPHSVLVASTGQRYNIATEAPGSVSGLTTQTGALVASWGYDVWGVPTTISGADTIAMALRFAAREYDVETGLYYNRARYYDPATGRFISEDPLGLAGGVNPYTYAGNNPVNATDPSGLKLVCEWGRSTTSSGGGAVSERYLIGCHDDGGGGGGWGFAPRPGGLGLGPDFGDKFVNFSAGFGDALLFRLGPSIRRVLSIEGVNKCSEAYDYGAWTAVAVGTARLAYAGLAKGLSMAAASGAEASAGRETLKQVFRMGLKFRTKAVSYPTDDLLRQAAGRTNPYFNALGAGAAAAGALGASGPGCR